MNVRNFFVGALLVAGALPLAGHFVPLRASEHANPPERAAIVAWPTHFRDQPLTQLPLGALEERFARRFPGAIARFTDGHRMLIVRQVRHRKLRAKYALIWLLVGAVTIPLAMIPGLLDDLASLRVGSVAGDPGQLQGQPGQGRCFHFVNQPDVEVEAGPLVQHCELRQVLDEWHAPRGRDATAADQEAGGAARPRRRAGQCLSQA